MRTFPVVALVPVTELLRNKLNYVQFASNQPGVNWSIATADPNATDDMHDPATGRIVDQVLSQVQDGPTRVDAIPTEMSFTDKAPFKELALQWAGGSIRQVGDPIRHQIDGVLDRVYTINGTAVILD